MPISKDSKGGHFLLLFPLVLCAVLFAPFLFGGRVVAPLDIVPELYQPCRGPNKIPEVHNHFVTDAVDQYIPYRQVFHQSIRSEGFVGWNPYIFGGTAQHANTMLISQEITLHLHRILDFWPAWNLGRLIQFVIAGIGMAVFLSSRGCKGGICALGATAYMLNQQFVAWIYFNQVVATFCWMPWVLWGLFQAREKSLRFMAPAGLFISLALLGATLQQAVFVATVLGCLLMGWLLEKKTEWPRVLQICICTGVMGAGLAFYALEPSIAAFFENTKAGNGRGQLGYDGGILQPLCNLLGSPLTVYPFLLGSVQSLDLWKLFKLDAFSVGFFGTLPMLIAAVGLFSRKVPLPPKLMMVVGFVVPLSPLVGYLYHRFNVVAIFGGCWAACMWLSKSEKKSIQTLQSRCFLAFSIFAGLWIVVSIMLVTSRSWLEPWLQGKVLAVSDQSHFGFFSAWMQARASRLIDYLCIWNPWQLLGVSGLILSFWGLGQIRKPHPWALSCAFGVALQLSVFWWQWTTWCDPRMPYGNTPLEQLLVREVGESGLLAKDTSLADGPFLPDNTLMPLGIRTTEGYDAMHPYGMRSLTGLKWDFPGTTHFLGKLSGPHPDRWNLVWQEGNLALWGNPKPSGGRVFLDGVTEPLSLLNESVLHPTCNRMEIFLPGGTRKAEIFSNWHRGWQWKINGVGGWNQVQLGENRTLAINLHRALTEETALSLRYDVRPPLWVSIVSVGSAAWMLLWACIPRANLFKWRKAGNV